MSEAYSCSVCGLTDRDLDRFDAKMRCERCTAPARVAEKPDPHIPYAGPLPSLDPYVQEFRERYGPGYEDLYPECDDINGGRRR